MIESFEIEVSSILSRPFCRRGGCVFTGLLFYTNFQLCTALWKDASFQSIFANYLIASFPQMKVDQTTFPISHKEKKSKKNKQLAGAIPQSALDINQHPWAPNPEAKWDHSPWITTKERVMQPLCTSRFSFITGRNHGKQITALRSARVHQLQVPNRLCTRSLRILEDLSEGWLQEAYVNPAWFPLLYLRL